MMMRVGNIGDKTKRETRAIMRILVMPWKERRSMVRKMTVVMTS
jgi:hypothetical protein